MSDRSSMLLGEDGPFARSMEHFTVRQGQQELADAIDAAIRSRDMLVAEAGTGIGKTFAYLTPVLKEGIKAVISTGTRTLQDQLYRRDLPLVLKVLGVQRRTALLKGRSNYLCLYRLDRSVKQPDRMQLRQAGVLSALQRWATVTDSGDLAGFEGGGEAAEWRGQVTSTAENCLGQECPFYSECFLVRARNRAQASDIVVVNHHLLFADMALKREGFGELLPEADVVIVDEAHRVPETATQFFGRDLSSRMVSDLVQDSRAEAAEVPGGLHAVRDACEHAEHALRRFRLALEPMSPRGPWGEGPAVAALGLLGEALGKLEQVLADLAPASRGLESCWHRICDQRQRLAALETSDPDFVAWYEKSGRGFSLHLSPLDIAEDMRTQRDASGAAWIFTSATLAADGRFDLFNRRLGLEAPTSISIESPFDYQSRALLFHPPGLPEPAAHDFVDRLLSAIQPLLVMVGGGAFLLFTSHRNLRLAAARLKQQTAFPLFIQGEAPRHKLLEAFKATPGALLLGAASFWEGVDVAGDALRCVVIDKLPFAAPDDPVLQGRIRRVKEEGGDPFRSEQLPHAVLTLKQGFGRLIRNETDYGIVAIGDPRLVSRGYGQVFLRSLPKLPLVSRLDDVRQFLARIRDNHEGHEGKQ